MDFLEQAFAEEQGRLDKSIQRVGETKAEKVEPTGYCLHCYEDLTEGKLFCNGKHADAYTAKQKFAVTH